jgi:hypothetical protein
MQDRTMMPDRSHIKPAPDEHLPEEKNPYGIGRKARRALKAEQKRAAKKARRKT